MPVRSIHSSIACIMAEAEGGSRRAAAFATGSEVAVAMDAWETLQDRGIDRKSFAASGAVAAV